MIIKNYNPQIHKELIQNSFEKDSLFENMNINDKQIKELMEKKEKWRMLLSYFRWYPDKFLDFMKEPNSKINLYVYQRIYLRIIFRYRKVFITATRGTSKSYLQNLAFILLCVMHPNNKLFVCAPGKEQAAKISQQCIDDIFEHYPFLKNEIKIFNYQKDYTRLIFHNGSRYDVVQMSDASRGGRRYGGAVEEICSEKFNGDVLHAVVIPLMANNRVSKNGKIDPNEIHKREIYITTASTQQGFAYEKLMEVYNDMIEGKSAFVLGNSYELPCMYNQLDIDFVESLKESPTYNIMDFMREYESIYTGSNADNLVSEEKLKKARKVGIAEWEHCGDSNVKYILSYDVSRSEGQENALCALVVIKLSPSDRTDGSFHKEIVNIFSMEGTHYLLQAKFLKEQVEKFKPIILVIDANSYGGAVVDNLVLDLGDGYPPYGVINDERYDKYRQPNSVNIVYALKSQNKESKDSDMITHIMSSLNKIDVHLLKAPHEGLKELKKKLKIKELDTDRDAELIIPYILTDILCEEIMNIRYKNQGHDSQEERISKRIQRDKYSALKYGLWVVYQEEMKNKIKLGDIDYSKLISTSSNNSSSQSKNNYFAGRFQGFAKGFNSFRR